MKSSYEDHFIYKPLLIFISLILIASPFKSVKSDDSGEYFISENDFDNAVSRNSVRFYEYENSKNLLNDFFGKNNEPNQTKFETNYQDLSLQIDSKNLRELYLQKLLEMSNNNSFIKETNNWSFFNSKI